MALNQRVSINASKYSRLLIVWNGVLRIRMHVKQLFTLNTHQRYYNTQIATSYVHLFQSQKTFCQFYNVNSETRKSDIKPIKHLEPMFTVFELLNACTSDISAHSKGFVSQLSPSISRLLDALPTSSKNKSEFFSCFINAFKSIQRYIQSKERYFRKKRNTKKVMSLFELAFFLSIFCWPIPLLCSGVLKLQILILISLGIIQFLELNIFRLTNCPDNNLFLSNLNMEKTS